MRIDHPAILPVFEFGQADGRAYLAMPLVDGGTLADMIKQRKLQLNGNSPAGLLKPAILDEEPYQQEAVTLITKIAHALAVAHQGHIVHRDIKPSNILIGRQEADDVYLSDFGLARDLDSTTQPDINSEPGTLAYMAPERFKSPGKLDEFRSDVYSLGVTLYELLTLRKARDVPRAISPALYLDQVLDREPTPPRQLNPTIHPDLEAIVLKASEYLAAHRYANAGELAADLDRYRAGEPVLARPLGPLARNLRKLRKYRKHQVPLAGMLTTFLILGLIWQGVNLHAASLVHKARNLLNQGAFAEASYVAAQAQAFSGRNRDLLTLQKELISETLRQYRASDDTTAFTHIHKLYSDHVQLLQQLAPNADEAASARRNFAGDLYLATIRVGSDQPDTWVTFHPTTRDGQPKQEAPIHALWAGTTEIPTVLPEVIEGVYWVTAYQPATGAFVEFPYEVPHNACLEPASLILHPRTHAQASHLVTKVEGGSFMMGMNKMTASEGPAHQAQVATFYLGTGEVTQQAFDDFLSEVSRTQNPLTFRSSRDAEPLSINQYRRKLWPETGHPGPDQGQFPWTQMSFAAATQFAAWYGCRLPSETELEYTARRNNGPLKPPGSPVDWNTAGPPWNALHPVGSLPQDQITLEPGGVKISGLYGNASEWTVFKFRSYANWHNEGETVIPSTKVAPPIDHYALAYEFYGQTIRSGLTETGDSPELLGYVSRNFIRKASSNKFLGFRLARSEQPKIAIEKLAIPANQK